MINSAVNYQISQLLDIYGNLVYVVPRYQREYTWEKKEWDEFFDDILDNDAGYFLGSMICINRGLDALGIQKLELVDGQQRMTTISLMLASIYSKLNEDNLKWMLVRKMNEDETRVVPQILNQKDYRAVLIDAHVLKSHDELFQDLESKLIFRAFRHFQNRLNELSDQHDSNLELTKKVLEKILRATLVKIEVSNSSDACMLFESLNNRGFPLTSVDLIKNKLFAKLKDPKSGEIDYNYEKWMKLLNYLGDDYKVQERFFRQYYNAFKMTLLNDSEKKGIKNVSVATNSNITQIYEKIIKRDPEGFLDKIIEAGKLYSFILGIYNNEKYINLKKPLLDLEHIQGTPSYVLLLYLLGKKDLELQKEHLETIVGYLVRFFVRRNLTDHPATNSLTPLFMKLIDGINGLADEAIVERIRRELGSVSSNDDDFRRSLEGPIYSENSAVTRFILCALEENAWKKKQIDWKKKEIKDFWEMNEKQKQYVWTIEHILPQGKKIPPFWIDMIAQGDKDKAEQLQAKYVDRIGNLTLTGYNPELSNKSFEEKKVGYQNGLYLNEDLKDCPKWTIDCIEQRTRRLVEETFDLFRLE
jgi:uncharacterized protein with ParB-like and HNH nuclease domain